MADPKRVIFSCANCGTEMEISAIWANGTAKLTFALQCLYCGREETLSKSHRDLNREMFEVIPY